MSSNTYPHLVFVYGTLMSGQPNNRTMTERDGAKAGLLGKATTLSKFWMSDGGFPKVSSKPAGGPFRDDPNKFYGQVSGELWRVNDESFANCDRLEGHPKFYKREVITVILNDGRVRYKAWIYLIQSEIRYSDCVEKNEQGLLVWRCPAWRKVLGV